MVKEGDSKLDKTKNRACLWFVVSTVYPKALFSHFRDKQFLKSQCQLFISRCKSICAQVKNTLDPKFQFPNRLFNCSLITTFQILHSLHLVSGLMVIIGYCAVLCEQPYGFPRQMLFQSWIVNIRISCYQIPRKEISFSSVHT